LTEARLFPSCFVRATASFIPLLNSIKRGAFAFVLHSGLCDSSYKTKEGKHGKCLIQICNTLIFGSMFFILCDTSASFFLSLVSSYSSNSLCKAVNSPRATRSASSAKKGLACAPSMCYLPDWKWREKKISPYQTFARKRLCHRSALNLNKARTLKIRD